MYTRNLLLPKHSFFLFGPRGTGKTTWLKSVLRQAKWFDLLRTTEFLRLSQDPNRFVQEVEALAPGSWVVVDEVQKLTALLNEIQAIITDHGARYRFALSGSSARKLKGLDSNLLAGRAINRKFFPLTLAELDYQVNVDRLLQYGCLPRVCAEPEIAVDILEAYAENYLREEIQQEALVKNLPSFARFLEIAAIMNGQVVNVAGLARDAAVQRPTVQRYFETLIDTLIGFWLPAWKPRAKVKEVTHPKFYFFDTGVMRALANRLRDPVERSERGVLLETLVLHELRSWLNVSNCGGQLYYWRTPSQSEVDFIWVRGRRAVGIEVKSSSEWKREFGASLKQLEQDGIVQRSFGLYLGQHRLKDGSISVLPLFDFVRSLNRGIIIG